MDKAKPVHPDGLGLESLHQACRTAAAGRETIQAKRAHQPAMGTLRSVHPPTNTAVQDASWNDQSLEPILPGACFAHPTHCQHYLMVQDYFS